MGLTGGKEVERSEIELHLHNMMKEKRVGERKAGEPGVCWSWKRNWRARKGGHVEQTVGTWEFCLNAPAVLGLRAWSGKGKWILRALKASCFEDFSVGTWSMKGIKLPGFLETPYKQLMSIRCRVFSCLKLIPVEQNISVLATQNCSPIMFESLGKSNFLKCANCLSNVFPFVWQNEESLVFPKVLAF